MAQEPHLDDQYTNGVYYDRDAGEYCRIVEINDTIGLTEPDSDGVYWTFEHAGLTKEEAIEIINKDFTQVSEEAVENPVQIVTRALRIQQRNSINELASVPEQASIDLGYARRQVNIIEQ